MEVERKDILFSPLEVREVKKWEQLRKSYSSYKSAFHHLAYNTYIAFQDSENENVGLTELLRDVFLIASTKKGADWKNLLNRYIEFLGQFDRFLASNAGIRGVLTGKGIDYIHTDVWKDRIRAYLQTYREPNDEASIREYLQLVADTKETVSCLWSVYEHFCIQEQMTTKFAFDGCEYLGVTWKDYFATIGKTAMGVIRHPIYETLEMVRKGWGLFHKNFSSVFDSIERNGAAFAEYAYTFDHTFSTHTVSVTPLALNQNADKRLRNSYVVEDCKLELHDADGMAVAMFDYQDQREGTVHCLSFAGTRLGVTTPHKVRVMVQNVITDLYQFVCGASKVYYAAVGILLAMKKSFPGERIFVFGHSLGGGLMQFACASVNSPEIKGYGYNSAGLSWYNMRLVAEKTRSRGLRSRIEHICAQYDPVSILGHQIGKVLHVRWGNVLTAHCLAGLNRKLNRGHVVKVWR